ncbi:MAG TPA: GNAT family N-acetyltransferase [Bacillota bacterium]|nr:GNAT family N-acetyltransferase [Bacillota bacterium]
MLLPLNDKEILNREPFRKDEVLYNLIFLISSNPNAIFATLANGKAIIAHNTSFPAWIWTSDDIDRRDWEELATDLYFLYQNTGQLEYIAKPKVAQFLAEDYERRRSISFHKAMDMKAYYCPRVILPTPVLGEFSKTTPEDAELIAKFLACFQLDCFGESVTVESQREKAKRYAKSNNFYVWRVVDEIVSMANIAQRSPRHARINEVYTPPKWRKNGFASALVAAISQKVLDENLIPMLYTDQNYPESNKVYQNIGFVASGELSHMVFNFSAPK